MDDCKPTPFITIGGRYVIQGACDVGTEDGAHYSKCWAPFSICVYIRAQDWYWLFELHSEDARISYFSDSAGVLVFMCCVCVTFRAKRRAVIDK